jgi:hypothetical protein
LNSKQATNNFNEVSLQFGLLEYGSLGDAAVQTNLILDSGLPSEAPSFITRVCGFGFHILHRQFGQAHRARNPQIVQAHATPQRVFDFLAMSVV